MNKEIEKVLDTFFLQYPKKEYKRGEKLVDNFEEIKVIFYLKSGNVKQTYISSEGNEMLLHIFKPVSFFPFMLGVAHAPNQYIFTAVNQVTAYVAPVDDVLEFVKDEPDVLFDLTTRFAAGINGMLNRLTISMYADSIKRLAMLLLYLSDSFGEVTIEGTEITLPLTHEELASWIGSTRETVSRNIEKLEKEGILKAERKRITITNKTKLSKYR